MANDTVGERFAELQRQRHDIATQWPAIETAVADAITSLIRAADALTQCGDDAGAGANELNAFVSQLLRIDREFREAVHPRQTCPECNGRGRLPGVTRHDPNQEPCPCCKGRRTVPA